MPLRNPQSFLAWIAQENADELELLDWCHHGFGRGREAEPPHLELAAALPRGGDNYLLRRTLARRMRRLLERWPNLRIPYPGATSTPDWLLHELLSFAAMLHCGEELFTALWAVYLSLKESGQQPSLEIQNGLRKALIHNQVAFHAEMLAIWKAMNEGSPDPILGGTPENGFEGAAMMPDLNETGRPNRAAMGEGLLALARRYEGDLESRWRRFRAWVMWLRGTWGLEREGAYFIMLAHDYQWVEQGQAWAVRALPDLCVQEYGTHGRDNRIRAHVWHWFARCLDPLLSGQPYWKPKSYCGGEISYVEFPESFSDAYDHALRVLRRALDSKRVSEVELVAHVEIAIQLVQQAVELKMGEAAPAKARLMRVSQEFHRQMVI